MATTVVPQTTYTITQEDIDAYLATKQDDDEIGRTCDSLRCLVAEALIWRYHLEVGDVSVDREVASIFNGNEILVTMGLSKEIQALIEAFDDCTVMGCAVTKREWLEAWEVTA